MAYLFDDASTQVLRKNSVIGMYSVSLWFYPDDTTVDCTLYAEYNAAGTAYRQVRFAGASGADKVEFRTKTAAGVVNTVTSGGTANLNAWNHVYAARGVVSGTTGYVSLNGETLQTGSVVSPSVTATAIGRLGTTAPVQYMSGMIAEVAVWGDCLSDQGDAYTALSLGFCPQLIAYDPTYSGPGFLGLISYTPLFGTEADWAAGDSWISGGSPTVNQSHPRIIRNFLE